VSDAERRPPEAGQPEDEYGADAAAADTGVPRDEAAEAWLDARQDAAESSEVAGEASDAEGTLRPGDYVPEDRIADQEAEQAGLGVTPPVVTLSFEDLDDVDSDEAELIGSQGDISGAEDLEEIDTDSDVDSDEDISTRDVGAH
jgi:hypothetical protein